MVFNVPADIFAHCALGGVVNDETIPQLKVQIVAGAANNQLLEERHGTMLRDRNILYGPDYVANAGGVLNGCTEVLGWEPDHALRKVDEIYDTILRIFQSAQAEGITTNEPPIVSLNIACETQTLSLQSRRERKAWGVSPRIRSKNGR